MTKPIVDVVMLSRDLAPLHADVAAGLAAQRNINVMFHRIVGDRHPEDVSRIATIARARNSARNRGSSPWVMFLDDDVVLSSNAISRLISGLEARPGYGALAADFLGDLRLANPRRHVAMCATLFRRSALLQIEFRATPPNCECQSCCDDLRKLGLAIEYLPGVLAWHLPKSDAKIRSDKPSSHRSPASNAIAKPASAPRILVAFNRRHYDRFRESFLRTLRHWGNWEQISIVGYGLYPSEQRSLSHLRNVDVVNYAVNGVMPPIRRLHDFQQIVASLTPDTPVAYWDAGDVVFQSSLQPLWKTVRENAGKLLAVREPKSHPHNSAVAAWTLSIRDPRSRSRAYELLTQRPFLNSGFAAGTADAMLQYLREAHRMINSADLIGTSDWGDQTALNLYCHSNSLAWQEIEEGWNYCVHDRQRDEFGVSPEGIMISRKGARIFAAHGNARSLRKLAILRSFP